MLKVFSITLPIFMLIGMGYAGVRSGLLSREHIRGVSIFVFYFALPALIVEALSAQPLTAVANVDYFEAYGLGSLVLYCGALAYFRWARGDPLSRAAILALGSSSANSGFIGYPVALMAIGPVAAIALALNMVIENMLMIPLALALGDMGISGAGTLWRAMSGTLRRLLRNPIILALIVGAALSFSGITLPAPIARLVDMLADGAAPAALFVVGGTLVGLRLRGMVSDVGAVVFNKLVLHPLAVGLGFVMFPGVRLQLKMAAVVIASVPMLSVFPILGQRYGQERVCAASLLTATILSFLSISVTIWLVPGIFG